MFIQIASHVRVYLTRTQIDFVKKYNINYNNCGKLIVIPTKEELLAGRCDLKEMADLINVDTLAFISIDGLYRAVGFNSRNNDTPQFCDACFSGNYPIALSDRENSLQPNLLSLLDEQV